MQFLKVKCNNKVLVEPLEKFSLFKHCTGGSSCVEIKEFTKEVVPVLQAHGVSLITYKESE
jgi:hypothetical protein